MTDYLFLAMLCAFVPTMAFGGLALWAVYSERFKQYRFRTPVRDPLPAVPKYLNIAMNLTLSLAIYFAVLYVGAEYLVYDAMPGLALFFGEVLASLLLYDLLYYFLHRMLHRPLMMKLFHGVHHKVHYPTAFDGLYIHPVELVAALIPLFLSIAVVGPISVAALLTVLVVHALVNIVVHTGLVLPHPAFKLTNYWVIRHDRHHYKHVNTNFAPISPYWDMMFGTHT